jgi:hypothetical protein
MKEEPMNDQVKVSCDCGWSRSWSSPKFPAESLKRAVRRHRFSVRCAVYAVRLMDREEQ